MQGNQRLVSGNHVLAALNGAKGQFLSQVSAANQFDDDFRLRIIHHGKGIIF